MSEEEKNNDENVNKEEDNVQGKDVDNKSDDTAVADNEEKDTNSDADNSDESKSDEDSLKNNEANEAIDKNTVSQWKLPGISGESILEKKYKILNPVDIKKKEDEEKKSIAKKIDDELQKGFSSGLIKGKDEAFKTESVRLKEKISIVNKLIKNFEESITNLEKELSETLVHQIEHVVYSLTRSIIKAELVTNPDIIKNAVTEALQYIPSKLESVSIFVNPEDKKILEGDEDLVSEKEDMKLEFKESEEINRGSCKVVSDSTNIIINMDDRLKETGQKVKDTVDD